MYRRYTRIGHREGNLSWVLMLCFDTFTQVTHSTLQVTKEDVMMNHLLNTITALYGDWEFTKGVLTISSQELALVRCWPGRERSGSQKHSAPEQCRLEWVGRWRIWQCRPQPAGKENKVHCEHHCGTNIIILYASFHKGKWWLIHKQSVTVSSSDYWCQHPFNAHGKVSMRFE